MTKSFNVLKMEIPDRFLAQMEDQDWIRSRKRFEKNPDDFFAAWHFLADHPANRRWGSPHFPYSNLQANLDMMVVKVHPEKNKVVNDRKKNTKTQIWVEWGPWLEALELSGMDREYNPEGCSSHDPRVDTGGDTFEQAIVNLAHNVWKLYGSRARIDHSETLPAEESR